MQIITVAILIAGLVETTISQAQQSCFSQFRSCMKDGQQSNGFQQVQRQVQKCKQENGCPEQGPQGPQGQGQGQGQGQNSQCRQEKMKSMKECLQRAGVSAPEDGDQGGDHHGGDHHGGGGQFQGVQNCQNPTRAKTCLQNVFAQFKGNNNNNNKQQRCQKKKACLNQLSPACQTELKQKKQAMCDCVKQSHGQSLPGCPAPPPNSPQARQGPSCDENDDC